MKKNYIQPDMLIVELDEELCDGLGAAGSGTMGSGDNLSKRNTIRGSFTSFFDEDDDDDDDEFEFD